MAADLRRFDFRRPMFAFLLLAGGAASVAGCAHSGDVVEAHAEGKGVARSYDATPEQAWTASLAVMHWAGADAVEEKKDEHYMLASVGLQFTSYGTLLGAWIEPIDPGHVSVSVVSKRKLAPELVTAMGEDKFHEDLAKALTYVKGGKPMPDKEP